MSKNREEKVFKYIDIAAGVIILLAIVLCVYVFASSNNNQTKITSTGSIVGVENYNLEGVGPIELPYSVKFKNGKDTVLTTTLPTVIKENYCLSFQSLYSGNDVYVDGELIGSYGNNMPLSFGRMTGNIRVIVPISPEMAGKELKLVVRGYYNTGADISEVRIGYTDEIKRDILNFNLFRMIVCVVLLTFMFIAVGIYIYQRITKSFNQINLVKSFVCFDFLVVTWIICSSDLPQFVTNCNVGVSLVSFLALSVICIPFMSMCEFILPRRAKVFKILERAGFLLPLIIGVCFVLNIADPMDILFLTHGYIIICIILAFVFTASEWRKGTSSKFLLVGMIEIAVSALTGLILWFIAPSKGYDATAFGIGFVLFISTLFALIGYVQVKAVEENKFMDIYKKLAYSDSLTNLKNRAAFELRFAQMQEREYKDVLVSLFMFDLNNLKQTNDTFGHQEGDKLIVGTGITIQKVFGELGEAFRLGGDEFAVLLTGYENDLSELTETFREELAKYGKENRVDVSCAVGYSQLKWNPGDTFFRDIYKIADKEMYADKIRTKAEMKKAGK